MHLNYATCTTLMSIRSKKVFTKKLSLFVYFLQKPKIHIFLFFNDNLHILLNKKLTDNITVFRYHKVM